MTITCSVCGTVNPEGTTYCEGCGVELAAPAAPQATPAASPQTNPTDADSTATHDPAQHDPARSDPGQAESMQPESMQPEPVQAAGAPLGAALDGAVSETAVDGDLPAVPEAAPGAPQDTPSPAPAGDPAPVAAALPASAPVATPETSARLGIKKYGAPTGEFIPLHGERLVVGRFDASSGPVDIDLSGLGGQEHISRRHAELYREGGAWMVRDLGSTNGVYVKHRGESAFSPRLQEPAPLADGDEVAFGNLMLTFHQGG